MPGQSSRLNRIRRRNSCSKFLVLLKGGGLFKFQTPTGCENLWTSGEEGGSWVGHSAAQHTCLKMIPMTW